MQQTIDIQIDITEKAANFLRLAMLEAKAIGIRLFVKNSGCSGKSYGIDLVTEKNNLDPLDVNFQSAGLPIFVEPNSYKMLKGMQLDLETQGINQFLRFNNPNAIHTCGCGESFKVEED